ncbi:MAG: type II toxin-antitoxin system prevent-host-death family antitoxin [Propionibacteriaceae bacterium]|jgi:antitoxin YefM|nr:type II toxin-antitoxin system prevent-host-death family antitoxin [Propionibacteriaceae bacterium]
MTAVTASTARREFFRLIRRVAEDAETVEIVAKHGNVVVVAAAEYRALLETNYLLSSPANAARLRRALADARAGRVQEHDLDAL